MHSSSIIINFSFPLSFTIIDLILGPTTCIYMYMGIYMYISYCAVQTNKIMHGNMNIIMHGIMHVLSIAMPPPL